MVSVKQAIDGSRVVRVKEVAETSVVFVWRGGHTVNVYLIKNEKHWEPMTAFTVGSFEFGEATRGEVLEGIEQMMEDKF